MIFGTPSAITNGLVLHYDIANKISYRGSGTALTDLSGNRNSGSLVNTPTFNPDNQGTLVFNGSNTYVSTVYTQPAYTSATSFTWNVWVRPTVSTFCPIIGNRGGSELVFTKLTPQAFNFYASPVANSTISVTMTLNRWQNISIVKNGSAFTYYTNARISGTATNANTSLSTTPFFIGGDPTSSDTYLSGNVAIVQVYNRALSAQEVSQNYSSIRSRFLLI